VLKTTIIYFVVRLSSKHTTSLKTALALSQVGEFSFVIFAVASSGGILEESLSQFLVLIVIFSMVVTPFFITRIKQIVDFLSRESSKVEELSPLANRKNHVVVCGYSVVGKFVTKELDNLDAPYIVVDNSYKHVKEAIGDNIEAYLGDVSKSSILNALHIQDAAAVIVTLDNIDKKRLICEAVLKQAKSVNLVVKVVSLEEKEKLADLDITVIVDGKVEVARVLVDRMISCQLKYK